MKAGISAPNAIALPLFITTNEVLTLNAERSTLSVTIQTVGRWKLDVERFA
jgi:hypothetical protein